MGKDLIQLGLKPSTKFAEMLDAVYQEQLNLGFKNKDDALSFVKENYLLID